MALHFEKPETSYRSEDAQYREQIKAAVKRRRETGRVKLIPDGCLCAKQAADEVGVTVPTLRYWSTVEIPAKSTLRSGPKAGKESYYPKPLQQHGYLLFTKKQVLLLKELAQFFKKRDKRGWRTTRGRAALNALVASIHDRWNG